MRTSLLLSFKGSTSTRQGSCTFDSRRATPRPQTINDHLKRLRTSAKGSIRDDVVKLIKGGFGLAESSRLWYLHLERGLEELGMRELKLSPGTFVYHVNMELKGIMAVHVDDIRMAFCPTCGEILEMLRQQYPFGDWKDATEEVMKFCGRWKKGC